MPSKCPIKLAAQRERAQDRAKAKRRAAHARRRDTAAAWLATHDGPLARKVRCILWYDGYADMTRDELHRETPEPPAEDVRVALLECGYTPARAAVRCVVPVRQRDEPATAKRINRGSKYAEKTGWRPLVAVYGETYTAHARLPAAAIGLEER